MINDFEIGESVVCINNIYDFAQGKDFPLIVGKVYVILDIHHEPGLNPYIKVMDEDNRSYLYGTRRFVRLSDHRLSVINMILE